MRYLIDLQHPAHFHFFRNLAQRLLAEGHEVIMTGRKKDILLQLCEEFGFEVQALTEAGKGFISMAIEVIQHQYALLKIIKQWKPDALFAIAGTFISIPGFLTRVPAYVFYDTEHATISNLLSYPFATCVYVPSCYRKKIRWRHERYKGYHELAYLHPNVFVPDSSVLTEVGLKKGDLLIIVRFVAWNAAHDRGLQGISDVNKEHFIKILSKYGKVCVVSEDELPSHLEQYRCQVSVSRMHHLMYFAALMFGESATMASEAAMLGVPSIYIDPVGRGYTDELEIEYGLVFNFTDQEQDLSIKKATEILKDYDSQFWVNRRSHMLDTKIDVNTLLNDVAINMPYTK